MAAPGITSDDSGYYHPLLIYGFWLEDEGFDVDWDRIYESIEMLNRCVREQSPQAKEPPMGNGNVEP